jgi:hypothetical protein
VTYEDDAHGAFNSNVVVLVLAVLTTFGVAILMTR